MRFIESGEDSRKQEVKVPSNSLGFLNPIGLAGGFDKNSEILAALPSFGFGFAEIGTVTPKPQVGNTRPRLFRVPGQTALFNRMGFNNEGAAVVSERLKRVIPELPPGFGVGINIGKNKDTPEEQAAMDYLHAVQPFRGQIQYVVINVSSPNTPGLRNLQSEERLRPILSEVGNELTSWPRRPLLMVKLAPELVGAGLTELIERAISCGAEGFILTNTLQGEWRSKTGGWSGAPLTEVSRLALIEARKVTRLPIVSVGGILTVEEARLRMELGATAIQIYSGWIYGGPHFPQVLAEQMGKV